MKRKELADFLLSSDPSTNFNKAISHHQENTGQWFLESADFTSWKTKPNSFLWLFGRPGCGKTTLGSATVQHLHSELSCPATHAVLYYFFDFNDVSKRSLEGLLRSLLIQLTSNSEAASQHLWKLYDSRLENIQLFVGWLSEALQSTLECFEKAMIVLDALDEVDQGERSELIKWIRSTITAPSGNIRLVVTSRRERQVEETLEEIHSGLNMVWVNISREAITEDIMAYIRVRLQDYDTYSGLKRWSLHRDVQFEIENALSWKADGLFSAIDFGLRLNFDVFRFRWVACQLDAIEDCYDLPSLRGILQSLPKSLDETYERIIQNMSGHQRRNAVRLLQILTFAVKPLHISEAVDAYAVNPTKTPAFEVENRLPNPLEITKLCGSLVTLVEGQYLQLAHSSVKEYLVSDRLQPSLQLEFYPAWAHASILQTNLGYMISILNDLVSSIESQMSAYPFLNYSIKYWFVHAQLGQEHYEETETIMLRVFQNPVVWSSWTRSFYLIHAREPTHLIGTNYLILIPTLL